MYLPDAASRFLSPNWRLRIRKGFVALKFWERLSPQDPRKGSRFFRWGSKVGAPQELIVVPLWWAR